jgi:signal transduction histidine kinase
LKLLQTTRARWTALYFVLFLFSSALLLFVSFLLLDNALRHQIDLRLSDEMNSFTSEVDIAMAIKRRSGNERGFRYVFYDKAGAAIAGELTTLLQHPGFFDAALAERGTTEQPDALRGLGQAFGDGFLIVATDTDDVENVGDTLLGVFGGTSLMAALLAFLGGRWLTGLFVARLADLAGTAEAITQGDMKRRMPLTRADDEIDRLSQSLNLMLDRNAGLLESQRQITNDIAHDLRTPLTRLRQKLEHHHQEEALADADELLTTMNALLRLAEIEEGEQKKNFRSVDLSVIAQVLVDAFSDSLASENKTIEVTAQGHTEILGDKALLTQMISNLIENISAHTPAKTAAHINVTASDNSVILQVSDNGPGVDADETEKILRRFYRSEKSRHAAGSGLGLSLVAAIAALHGASLEVQNLNPGLAIALRFPRP